MSGNYGYSNYSYNRPPDSQSRQPPPGAPPNPQAPQYAHGHQTYAAHAYQNPPPPPYMNYPQYSHQPYSQQPPFVNDSRRIDYPPYQQPQPQPLPPNQPPRPGAPPSDQYTPTTAPAMYNSWMNERSSPQQPARGFDEEAEKKYAINVFKRFDQDAGGYLDLQEFMDALRALHLAIPYHEALDCFGRYDVNEDGRISQDEFVRIYVSEMRNRSYAMHQYPQMARNHPPPPPMRP